MLVLFFNFNCCTQTLFLSIKDPLLITIRCDKTTFTIWSVPTELGATILFMGEVLLRFFRSTYLFSSFCLALLEVIFFVFI
jgi:hypothetical protein